MKNGQAKSIQSLGGNEKIMQTLERAYIMLNMGLDLINLELAEKMDGKVMIRSYTMKASLDERMESGIKESKMTKQ